MKRFVVVLVAIVSAVPAFAGDLCAGKKAGSVVFFDQEISRDAKLPKPVTTLDASKPMFALMCLSAAAGPQETGGEKFRIVMYVDGKQNGVFRPQLSKSRKDIILAISENFEDELKTLDAGEHELRFQAATETKNGKVDVDINLDSKMITAQELRNAGYVADGKIKMTKPE